MQIFKRQLKQNLTLIGFSIILAANQAIAATDLAAQESYLKARIKSHEQNTDHTVHMEPVEKSLEFHGIFYGFLPCKDCNGIKSTLSLKQKNNYLLVTQPAKESSKENYEKGKYTWDEENNIVVLTPRNALITRKYLIKDEETLILLNSDGSKMTEGNPDSYTMRRSDTVKAREVHIH